MNNAIILAVPAYLALAAGVIILMMLPLIVKEGTLTEKEMRDALLAALPNAIAVATILWIPLVSFTLSRGVAS